MGGTTRMAVCPLAQVRATCEWVCQRARHVTIDGEALDVFCSGLTSEEVTRAWGAPQASFDKELHFFDGGDLTGDFVKRPGRFSGCVSHLRGDPASSASAPSSAAQYLLCVDALNFCFWPAKGLEYEHLARGLKRALERDPGCLDAARLACIDEGGVRALFDWDGDVPLIEERARLLREVGAVLQAKYRGRAAQLVRSAGRSASRLVDLVARDFPGFRDSAVYEGRQVFFYKRAQIFVGDLWGAFGGAGLGEFTDIADLTMFPDYRVPALLSRMDLLRYSDRLRQAIEAHERIEAGSPWESEIRAATVTAVERMRARIRCGPGMRVAAQGREPEDQRTPLIIAGRRTPTCPCIASKSTGTCGPRGRRHVIRTSTTKRSPCSTDAHSSASCCTPVSTCPDSNRPISTSSTRQRVLLALPVVVIGLHSCAVETASSRLRRLADRLPPPPRAARPPPFKGLAPTDCALFCPVRSPVGLGDGGGCSSMRLDTFPVQPAPGIDVDFASCERAVVAVMEKAKKQILECSAALG